MKKFIVPMAIALAMTASGAAFAESFDQSPNAYLYEQASPFAVPTDSVALQTTASYSDPRLDTGSQQASTSAVQRQQQIPADQPAPWTDNGIFGAHGPE
jgi:hypothetical protein